ncbi:MAG TPA: hypothetical protein VFE86_10220 [Ilumatobacteraceae bacterium]|nr:hypothetical protein [Ilumatobacteraceae bacterium]
MPDTVVSLTNFGAGAAGDDPVPSLAHPNKTLHAVVIPTMSVPERLVPERLELDTLGLNHTDELRAVRHPGLPAHP